MLKVVVTTPCRYRQASRTKENRMDEFLTLKQVADRLKLQHYRIHYALATRRIPEPALRVSNRRVFQPADVERIKQHFNLPSPVVESATIPAS
jgi:hypothetical protein